MSLELARVDIVAELETAKAAWTTYALKIEYPNIDMIDLATQTLPFLAVDIVWNGGEQADLADHPLVENTGQIFLAACDKMGNGTKKVHELLDFFTPYLEMRDMTTIRTHAAEPVKFRERLGWYCQPLIINFWFHRVSSSLP